MAKKKKEKDQKFFPFTDADGRVWHVPALPIGVHWKWRDLHGIDITTLDSDEGLAELSQKFQDPTTLVPCIYLLVEKQAKDRKFTEERFYECLDDKAYIAAFEATMNSIIHFFQGSRRMLLAMTLKNTETAAIATCIRWMMLSGRLQEQSGLTLLRILYGKSLRCGEERYLDLWLESLEDGEKMEIEMEILEQGFPATPS